RLFPRQDQNRLRRLDACRRHHRVVGRIRAKPVIRQFRSRSMKLATFNRGGHAGVTALNEEPKAFDGVTTIDALVEGKMRRVFVTFAKDDAKIRDALIDAFKYRKRISFTGELLRDGRRLRLETPVS